jgi:predicted DNA-binding transcriptional regulator AlpA
MSESTKPITESELADRWGITTRTLQLWRKKGFGPQFIRLGERSIFYRRADVEAYEAVNIVGNPVAPVGWDQTVKRAAGAFDVLSEQAKSAATKAALIKLRDELRNLLP